MAEAVTKYCPECAKKSIEHPFQDKEYGKFKRVMSPTEKGGYRCSICKSIVK